MKKLLSLLIAIYMISGIFGITAQASKAVPKVSKVSIVKQPQANYNIGDTISLTIKANIASGNIQYRVVIINTITKKSKELWANSKTKNYLNKSYKSGENVVISVDTKTLLGTGKYTIVVYARRVGSSASYESSVKSIIFNINNELKKITIIDDIEVDIYAGEVYEFPNKVYAGMSDGTIQSLNIKWDSTNLDTSIIGQQTFYGSVEKYAKKVRLLINTRDASEKSIAKKSSAVAIQDNWMYLPKGSSFFGSEIHKRKLDGKYLYPITKDTLKNQVTLVISGNWIYYNSSGIFYKSDINGNNGIKLNTAPVCWPDMSLFFIVKGDWIYYSNSGYTRRESSGMYKLKIDGTENIRLDDKNYNRFDIQDDWIYYIDGGFKVSKMRLDGTEKTETYKGIDYIESLTVSSDWIYIADKAGISKIKIDGTENIRISQEKLLGYNGFYVNNDWIYYSAYYGEPYENKVNLYKIKIDGFQKITITENFGYNKFNLVNGWIYYFNNEQIVGYEKLIMIKEDGTQKKELNLK